MFLDRSQIATNVNRLLERASPPVVYLTRKNILDDNPGSTEMIELWGEVLNFKPVRDILSRQEADGSWCAGGAWAARPSYKPAEGYEPTSPKYATTAWILPLLGDMGLDTGDRRIRNACNYLLTYQWPNGFFASSRYYMADQKRSKDGQMPNHPCHFALYLWALARVGMGRDILLQKSFDLLASWQRDDGGWLRDDHLTGKAAPYKIWDRGCPWSTYHTVAAFYYARRPEYEDILKKGLEFLLWHLSTKNEVDICQMHFHGHNPVRELVMFSDTGIGIDSGPVQALTEWLTTMYNPDKGYFKYNGKPVSKYSAKKDGVSPRVMKYRLYHLIEDDWLTYYCTLIGKKLIDAGEPAAVIRNHE